ncbi:hypothetical protein QYE76_022532 [Lolium multiflorum]|uniref:Uncharacterized protein n=1 Tax=Lolium multiflorum TaxID=4521 RepID=A0AAD8VTV2_LOLMU|nr:hypothetical protein QYE76_022532 [Lolium multiflorum]
MVHGGMDKAHKRGKEARVCAQVLCEDFSSFRSTEGGTQGKHCAVEIFKATHDSKKVGFLADVQDAIAKMEEKLAAPVQMLEEQLEMSQQQARAMREEMAAMKKAAKPKRHKLNVTSPSNSC